MVCLCMSANAKVADLHSNAWIYTHQLGLCVQVQKRDGRKEALSVSRPVKKITSPVDAYLDDRGARKVQAVSSSCTRSSECQS